MELPERLARIDGKLDRLCDRQEDLCDRFEEHVAAENQRNGRMEKTLYGSVSGEGLVTQVALLKDGRARRSWMVRTVLAAIVAAVVGALLAG